MPSGLIAGALGGAAGAAQQMAQGAIEDERKLDLSKQLSDMEEQRQLRIAEAAERTRQAGRQADFTQDMANAPQRNAAEAARTTAVGTAENAVLGERSRQAGTIEQDNAAALGRNPAALAGIRAEAQAQHVEGSGVAAQARLDNAKAADIEEHRNLLNEREQVEASNMSPEQRQKKLAQIDKRLEANARRRGVAQPPADTDVVKVTEETEDPATGKKTKRESTEKRVVPKGAPAKPAGPAKQTATRAEVEAYAKSRGISVESAIKGLEAANYTIH